MLLVQTEEQFEAALDMMRKASVIAVDTETRGTKGGMFEHVWHGNRLIGFSTHCKFPGTDYSINFYFPFRHQHDDKVLTLFTQSENLPIELLPKFAEILNRSDVYLKFWHLKFDAQVFRADGLWLTPNIERTDDGMPKVQLVDENISHRLKDVGALLFGDHVKHEEEKLDEIIRRQGGYHKTTPQQMASYACRDAQLTHDVDPILDEALEVQGLTHLVRREMQFQIVMMEMEWEGIAFDKPLAEGLAKKSRMRMREIEDELGFDPQKRDALAHELFGKHALQDTPGGDYYLPAQFELTKNRSKEFPEGVPKMNEQVLVGLRDPVADLVLEYRGLGKANSTWYEGWIKRLGTDGRLHPTYNHSDKKAKYGTVTSRLSSFIQQMPRDPDAMVKLLLKPEPGHVMVEYDYSQIEYREAAIYSGDEQLIAAFINGDDLHQQLADQLGIDRDSAKQTAYTVLYGGQGKALALNLMKQVWQNEKKIVFISEAEGQEIVNAYYNLHPKVKNVSNQAKQLAKARGYVTLWNGRRRHFGPKDDHRKAFNSVLQGGAAQIIEESMLAFHDMRDTHPFRMRVQVHDSLWFSIPLEGFDKYDLIIKRTMEWPTEKFPVPFPVDSKIIRYEELREDQLRGNLLGARPGGDDGLGSI